jgi:sigma-54 dependent transcriptional regulator
MYDQLAISDELIHLAKQVATVRNQEQVLGEIVASARRLTRAEGGRILVLDRAVRHLHCVIGQNDANSAASAIPTAVPVYNARMTYNLQDPNIYSLVTGKVVNLDDVYSLPGFDSSPLFTLDRQSGYRTKSLVIVPLLGADNVTLGVLQLVNLRLGPGGEVVSLPEDGVQLVSSFAAHAAVALSITRLLEENRLFIRQLDRQAAELKEENSRLHQQMESAARDGIIGESPAIMQALDLTRRAASSTRVGILLLGETGTGKDVFAAAIHHASELRKGAFVVQNCAAMPEALLESELFGHRKGSFSGAVADKKGLIQEANGGTLFLDEIGEMPLGLQPKILRALEDGVVRRIGDTRAESVDIRIIAATNADLAQRMANGTFREDLYYRLSVFPIRLPPLRERPSDIPLLIDHFLTRACKAHARAMPALTADALDALCCWRYPGNVRELRNIIERALLLLDEGQRIDLCHLPTDVSAQRQVLVPAAPAGVNGAAIDLKNVVQQYEARMIEAKLREAGWNQSRAAKMLNISRRSLVDKLNRYAIRGPNLTDRRGENIVGQPPAWC